MIDPYPNITFSINKKLEESNTRDPWKRIFGLEMLILVVEDDGRIK